MQRCVSSRMRGGSVVGAVLLVALISAVAIGLESQNFTLNQTSQVAAPSCASNQEFINGECRIKGTVLEESRSPGQPVVEGYKINTPAFQNQTCKVGDDFILRMNPDGSDTVLYHMDKEGKVANTSSRSQCPSIGVSSVKVMSQGERNARSCVSASSDPKITPWKCYIQICKRKNAQGAQGDDCFYPDLDKKNPERNPIPVGASVGEVAGSLTNSIDSGSGSSGADIAKILNDPDASSEEKQKALEKIPTLPTEEQQQLSTLLDGKIKQNNELIGETNVQLKNTTNTLQDYLKQGEDGKCRLEQQLECELLQQRQSAQNKKIQELTAQNKDLLNVKMLTSSAGNEDDSNNGGNRNDGGGNNQGCAPD